MRVKDATIGQTANDMAAAQKRIEELESEIDRKMSAASYVIEQLAASQAQISELKDFAIWLTGCGYDFTQHPYFIEQRDRPLKKPHDDSALRELLKAERERCAKVIERLISGDGICADDGVWIHDCAEAIRAMEDQ